MPKYRYRAEYQEIYVLSEKSIAPNRWRHQHQVSPEVKPRHRSSWQMKASIYVFHKEMNYRWYVSSL